MPTWCTVFALPGAVKYQRGGMADSGGVCKRNVNVIVCVLLMLWPDSTRMLQPDTFRWSGGEMNRDAGSGRPWAQSRVQPWVSDKVARDRVYAMVYIIHSINKDAVLGYTVLPFPSLWCALLTRRRPRECWHLRG